MQGCKMDSLYVQDEDGAYTEQLFVRALDHAYAFVLYSNSVECADALLVVQHAQNAVEVMKQGFGSLPKVPIPTACYCPDFFALCRQMCSATTMRWPVRKTNFSPKMA